MWLAAAVAMVLAGVAVGQVSPADAQERETIAKLLASPRDSDKAWGAVLTAKYKQPQYVPDILGLLDAMDYRVRLAALDALISLGVDPPGEIMSALLDAHPEHFDAALILMGRLPNVNRAFLESLLSRSPSEWQWAATNAVLSLSPGAVQTAHLWNQWKLALEVAVTDPDGKPQFARVLGSCVDSIPAPPDPDFPPVHFQRLFEPLRADSANLFVARGPHRLFIGNDPSPNGGCYPPYRRQNYVRDYLEYFAGRGDPLPEAVLRWHDATQYRNDARDLLARLNAYISGVRQRLIDRGLLPEDASQSPKLEVTVSDQRLDKSVPLPSVDFAF